MKRVLLLFFIVNTTLFIYGQTTKTVNNSTSGNLKNLITATEQNTVTTLTVTGSIDARDFAFMRDKLKVLSVLNLSMASIKAYTGTEGTNTGVNTTYNAYEIPLYAFYDPALFTYKGTLTSINLPSTATKIGEKAFYYAYSLSSLNTIPASLTKIGSLAFYGCSSISSFSVAPSNPRYSTSSGVLFNKSKDSLFIFPPAKGNSYSIPTTVKHIGSSAFDNCYKVSSVSIPTSVTSIGSYA